MITHFKVINLNGKDHEFHFHKDINIFTGKNGSGKTTVLKLLWYLVSGNIERVFTEMTFSNVLLEGYSPAGEKFKLEIKVNSSGKDPISEVEWSIREGHINKAGPLLFPEDPNQIIHIDSEMADATGSSVFFPTFRRIEGGFSISGRGKLRRREDLLQDGMAQLSKGLSYHKHLFVSSIATYDIESLITNQVAINSDKINLLQGELTKYIKEVIDGDWNQIDREDAASGVNQAREILSGIEDKVRGIESQQIELTRPITVLTGLIQDILKQKGLRLNKVYTFGDTIAAIEADHLSAGEKQMLSFLCYNAFQKGSMIFIDEPEISLHVDWQRILFPKLMEQASDNQFIIATHSPFIYSKYSDKEHQLDADRGGNGEE